MKPIRILLASLVFCLTLPSVGSASAQAYPNRPVRLIVPFAAGSGTDIIARIVSHKLGEALGQQIVGPSRSGQDLADDCGQGAVPAEWNRGDRRNARAVR